MTATPPSVAQADEPSRARPFSRTTAKAVEDGAGAPELDERTTSAVRRFVEQLGPRYAGAETRLFGSRARGTHRADSDADLALILPGPNGDRWSMTRELSALAFDVMLETGTLIQPLVLWEGELHQPGAFSNPALVNTILREGRPV